MFLFTQAFLLLHLLFTVSSVNFEDLDTLFNSKHCIEASLVSLFSKHDDPIMFDAKSSTQETLYNKTISTDKTVTSKIHELAQYNNIRLVYKLILEDGPAHKKIYTVQLILEDESYEGSGSSLKAAKESAAALALENTLYEIPPVKLETQPNLQTPTVVLNNLAMKLGIGVSYYLLNGEEEQTIESYGAYDDAFGSKSFYPKLNSTFDPLRIPIEDAQISGPFIVKVKFGEFSVKGVGHTIQAARHDAAFNAIKHMEKEALFKDNVCSKDETTEQCKQKKESLKSPITRVHEAGQKRNLPVSFDIIEESGKSHQKLFITRCTLGEFVTEGEGKSKKESKRVAAEKMLKHLPEITAKYPQFDENVIVNGLSSKKKKKKKKNKMIKDTVASTITDGVSSIISSLWVSDGTPDTNTAQQPKGNTRRGSPKDKILDLSNKLNIPIEFTDIGEQGDQFISLMSLGVRPPHICLGKATTREKSHDVVALHGMKFLQKLGIFDRASSEEKSDENDDVEPGPETMSTPFDAVKEK